MTIGIAAAGPGAGAAIRDGLRMAERIGAGDIGGFVAFAAITVDGRLLRCETQAGGIAAALANAGDDAALAALLEAPIAALMSSGPDRPEPLSQFVPGDPRVGLVTGHRRPDLPAPDERAVNLVALDLMRQGADPQGAVDGALAMSPEIDAGLLAIAPSGLAAADSARVRRRTDRGMAIREGAGGRAVGVVHNSIRPVDGLAELVAGLVLAALGEGNPSGELVLPPGTPLVAGGSDAVDIDASDRIVRIESCNPHLVSPDRWTSAAVYLGSRVRRDGRTIGRTTTECRARIEGGRIVDVAAPGRVAWQTEGEA